jgi:DNA-binding transcriptional MocR family regulator
LSRQLAAALRQAVADGSFGAGARLPSTRDLAADLGIARSTAVVVFEQLAAEGYIEARQGSGYFVAAPLAPAVTSKPDGGAATARTTSRHAKLLRLVTVEIIRAAESRIVPVPVDAGGLDIAAGRRKGEPAPRLIYTTPSRQYPLGMAMPLARRRELLDLAEGTGSWIVEDDYESEFQEPSRALPSLQGLDRAGRVVYLGTFSKLLFPSLRLGYAVLPDDLVRPFVAARYLADRHSSGLLQGIMTEFILDGHFARHLKRMRAHYRERQEFLIDLLRRRLRGVLEIAAVESGMYLTASLPPGWSDRATAAALLDAASHRLRSRR